MTPQKSKELVNYYCRFFSPDFHIECGDGWFNLIRMFCDTLDQVLTTGQIFKFVQIKEKWGSLRVYFDFFDEMSNVTENTDVHDLVYALEGQSKLVCETCGKPGYTAENKGWYATLCDPCRRQLQ